MEDELAADEHDECWILDIRRIFAKLQGFLQISDEVSHLTRASASDAQITNQADRLLCHSLTC